MTNPLRAFVRCLMFVLACYSAGLQAQSYDGGGPVARVWTLAPSNPTGAAPADALEQDDVAEEIAGFDEDDWIVITDGTWENTPGREKKFRVTCEPTLAKQLDSILYHGVPPPVGHRHQGTGNRGWNETSDYASLRADPSSTCSGGPLNGTNYWEPEMMKLVSSLLVGLRPEVDTFYYVTGTIGDPNVFTWLRRNFAFIGGANPSDNHDTGFNDGVRRAEYAAAGFMYPGSPDTPAGMVGWECHSGNGTINVVSDADSRMKSEYGAEREYFARFLQDENGDDPWGGACTGDNEHPGTLILNLWAPDCWDRTNLRAPTGREHVAYSATTSDSTVRNVCPEDYGRVPRLEVKREYRHTGWDDYKQWFLSSDRMNAESTPADPESLDPCRATGPWYCPGSTAHFDWIGGWKADVFDEWQRECLGIPVRGIAPEYGPAECNASSISKYRRMIYTGASPDPEMSGGCDVINACTNATPGNPERYNPLDDNTAVDLTIEHQHSANDNDLLPIQWRLEPKRAA